MSNRIFYSIAALVVAIGLGMAFYLASSPTGTAENVASMSIPAREDGERKPSIPSIAAGNRAADFKLESLDGKDVSLGELGGKVVFLNLWATWCGPCREEMPSMETLFEEFRDKKDFVMLAVSQDTKGRAVVAPYVEKNGYHFTVLLDPRNILTSAYDVSGVPETFIINRAGRIVAHHMGAFDWSRPDVKDALRQLLEAKDG
jgi:peroxiredoxin